MSKKALGKGLSAIISSSTPSKELESIVETDKDKIEEIDVDFIKPNPDQPRDHFDKDEIRELAESIKSVGIIQPIILRKEGDNYFIVAGERRLRASKMAGLKKIKSIIIEPREEENLTIALIENLQRKDLDPIEEAKAYRVLVDRFKMKQQDIARRVGRDRATITNALRLLNLDKEIQHAISDARISVGHAKVLLSTNPAKQKALYKEILNKGLSVRALEQKLEKKKSANDPINEKSEARDPHIKKMEEKLISIFGTKVEIKHSGGSGKIEIT